MWGGQQLASYRKSAGDSAIDVLYELASSLRGVRVLHLSATPYGGGVAELLRSQVPLLRDLGLAVDWKLIAGDDAFFSVTKAIHNALQGADEPITDAQWDTYLSVLGAQRAAARSHVRRDRRARPATAGNRAARRTRQLVVGLAMSHRHVGTELCSLATALAVRRGL